MLSNIKVSFFFNSERGIACLDYLSKKKIIKINSIFIAKKNLKKNLTKFLKKKKIKFKYIQKESLSKLIKQDIYFKGTELNLLCGFPYILEKNVVSLPRFGTLNLHGGKLPEFRGGSPINWQIIKGKKKIGLSVIKIKKGIDTGDIASERAFPLNKNQTIKRAHQKANKIFPRMLYESIIKIIKKKKLKKQNGKAKYYKQRSDKDGQVSWKKMNSTEVVNFVRAISFPYPGAYTFYEGKKIRIFNCKKTPYVMKFHKIGNFIKDKNKFIVKTQIGCVKVTIDKKINSKKGFFNYVQQ